MKTEELCVELEDLANHLRTKQAELDRQAAQIREWTCELRTKQERMDADHAERLRSLEAREKQVADVRKVAADRKALIETLKQSVEEEKQKEKMARARALFLESQVERLEATLADTLARVRGQGATT